MRPAALRIALLLAAAVLAACDLSDVFGSRTQREQLARNRARWEALGLRDYDFDYRLSCYCLPESTTPVRIEVRSRQVARVLRLSNGEVIPLKEYPVWPTIDSLFVWTNRAFDESYRLTIRYDARYHFPGYVDGDIPGAVDDEFSRTAENLVRK